MQYDVFISHSSRDKDEVARPLAQALEDRGLQVWLDEEQLQIGDSIRRGIDAALRESRFGLVVLSPAYLNSEWGQKELDAFFAKEKYNTKSILPIYHGISIEDVEQHWPMLADKISLNTNESNEQLADKIQQSIQSRPSKPTRLVALKNKPWWPSNNWQWLIGIILALAAIVIPIWHSTSSPSNSGAVSIQGDMSGGTVIGNQTNHLNIDSKAAQLIAKSLLQNSKQTSNESFQEKEAEIKRLTETIARLQQQPSDELKQSALKKLEEDKPEEAAQLLKQSLVKRGKALQVQSKQMSKDWLDVGNIAYLKNTQEAFEAYSKAIALNPANIEAWNRLGHINHRLGNLDESITAYETVLKLDGDDQSSQTIAFGNLGLIYQTRGELDKAEEFHLKALKINEAIGRQEGMAADYGNLGLIYQTRGELDKAEESHLRALKINEAISNQEGIAADYGNLGQIYRTRGELNKAKEFHLKALKINEVIGRQEGMANQYGNLGVIYEIKGELGKAEELYLKALKINEAIGRQEGMADAYGNLGEIYRIWGELGKAEEFQLKSLNIDEALGSQSGMSADYVNLGLIYRTQGELDKAEKFYLKALKIDEALGLKKGVAVDYGNLGGIYATRGELDKAKEFYLKALKINEAIGRQEGIANQYINLGGIYEARGELKTACGYWLTSLDIFNKVGSVTARQVQNLIDEYCQ